MTDLIRKSDALDAVRVSDFRWDAEDAIADLPAVTLRAMIAKVPTRYQTVNGDRLLHESDLLAAMEPVAAPAPATITADEFDKRSRGYMPSKGAADDRA